MNEKYFTERQIEILKNLEKKLEPQDMYILTKTIEGSLPKSDIEAVCQIINNEYLMRGINDSFNPNDYGKELEILIDFVNRPRILWRSIAIS